jgi:hypothetical protein
MFLLQQTISGQYLRAVLCKGKYLNAVLLKYKAAEPAAGYSSAKSGAVVADSVLRKVLCITASLLIKAFSA